MQSGEQLSVSHVCEFEATITGGIRESVRHQRKMLEDLDIEYTTDPDLGVDVLHCNLMGPKSAWYARRARSRGIPVIVNTHLTAEDFGDSFRFSNALAKPLRRYLRWAYGLADVLVCPSAYNRRLISRYTDTPTRVISNGVDREKLRGFESLAADYRERFDLQSPVAFQVGHVFKRKGLETFVETARRLQSFDFAWFGPLDRLLKGRSTRRLIDSAPDNCTFTGFVDDIRGAYAVGDVFFFPTYEENEGIALLEAMAAGTPPVVRDIETFSWLEDGHDCLKVSEDDLSTFVDTLDRLGDAAVRRRLGANANAQVDRFELDAVAEQYAALYDELTGNENPDDGRRPPS